MSSTEELERVRRQGAEHAARKLPALARRLEELLDASAGVDSETADALTVGIADYLSSCLWQRRNLRSAGGLCSTAPGEAERNHREAFLEEAGSLLRGQRPTPAQVAYATGTLAALMFAEFDGSFNSSRDFELLELVDQAWRRIPQRPTEGSQRFFLRFYANAVISVSHSGNAELFERAIKIALAALERAEISVAALSTKAAESLIDIYATAFWFEGTHPDVRLIDGGSVAAAAASMFFGAAMEKAKPVKRFGAAVTAVGALQDRGNDETLPPWSWIEAALADSAVGKGNISSKDLGPFVLRSLAERHLAAERMESILVRLDSVIGREGTKASSLALAAAEGFGDWMPLPDPARFEVALFYLRLFEGGFSDTENVPSLTRGVVTILVQLAIDGHMAYVIEHLRSLAGEADRIEPENWPRMAVVYRAIAMLMPMPAIGPSDIAWFAERLAAPCSDHLAPLVTAHLEQARRAGIDALLARDDLDLDPARFFPLLGLQNNERP